MPADYKIIFEGGTGEIVEKRSRFIADIAPVETEEEAYAFIEKIRKQYWDARHHCFAFVIGPGQELMRFSDDGEPGGTAGKPMLDILLGEELHNAVAVVTRYFGGTLLGTGGLVRAYQGAVHEGLKNCTITEKCTGVKLVIDCDYTLIGKIQYILAQSNIRTLSSDYTDKVTVTALVPSGMLKEIMAKITEGTNAKAHMEAGDECCYIIVGGEVMVL